MRKPAPVTIVATTVDMLTDLTALALFCGMLAIWAALLCGRLPA